jgi:glycosyltransferase involved in cell wall biosynthesis
LRVLITTSTFPRFHGDRVTPFMADLVRALAAIGVEVDVLAPHSPGSEKVEALGDGIRVYRFRYAWPESAEDIFYGAGALENLRLRPAKACKLPSVVATQALATWRLARSRGYDVIHAHWLLPQGLTAIPGAFGRGIPLVATAHGSDVFALKGPFALRAKRVVTRSASVLTANSQATADALLSLGADAARIRIVPIGAGAREGSVAEVATSQSFAGEAGPLLLFVGRLVESKGADDAIAALALLRDRLPGARLVVVGDGPEKEALAAHAASLGIPDRVSFRGWLEPAQVSALMRMATVLLAPSRRMPDGTTEGQGVVPLEAMLAGLPVVASRVGGLTDIVRHETTGLLVSERSPQEVAEAVVRLVSCPALAERLAATAGAWALSEGTIETTARRFRDIYEQCRQR